MTFRDVPLLTKASRRGVSPPKATPRGADLLVELVASDLLVGLVACGEVESCRLRSAAYNYCAKKHVDRTT